jgi:very-short-patch-repair endonuclease
VASWQLVAAGISYDTAQRLVRRGAMFRLHQGVYAVGHRAPIEYGDETGALLAVGDRGVLGLHSAAPHWGMRSTPDGLIHVVVAGGSVRAPAGVRVHTTKILTPRDVRVRSGLPLTSPARTLLDLAEVVTARRLELAFDQALVSRLMSVGDVDELLRRVKGRAGAPLLRALALRERGPTITRSQAEEQLLALVRGAGLPEPEVNVKVHGYEVDFYWRNHRLIVEIDGYRYHSTARAFEHDRHKDVTLKSFGLSTMRFTARALRHEPLYVVARMTEGLLQPRSDFQKRS